jgi:hypothetical protein
LQAHNTVIIYSLRSRRVQLDAFGVRALDLGLKAEACRALGQ